MKNLLLAVIATAVIVGGGAFYGGMQYGKKNAAPLWGNGQSSRNLSLEERQQRVQQFGGGLGVMGSNGVRAGNRGGDIVNGEVLTKDATSITVKLRDGGSKIVLFSDSTEIGKFARGTIEDVSAGETVTVSGKANTDGSVTAQSVQIRPAPATKPAPIPASPVTK